MLQACSEQSITLINDPSVSALPINESHEPLVDLRGQTIISLGPSPEIPNNQDYTKVRKSVYEKLLEAQKLLPVGLRFCLYEGYRSLTLQDRLFKARYAEVQRAHSAWSHEEIFMETTKLVSPLTNLDGTQNVPPHSTGAAVDVYLIDENGNPVDMGMLIKDWIQDVDGSLSLMHSTRISQQAKNYRNIMSEVLSQVGLVNYPTEYWHWSYGDRYWAFHKGVGHAMYGSVRNK